MNANPIEIIKLAPELTKLFEDLIFVSKIKPGFKVNLGSRTFKEPSPLDFLIRGIWAGESREKLYIFIGNLLSQTVASYNRYRDTKWGKIILENLSSSRKGIENLKETYSDDPDFTTKIDVLLSSMDDIIVTAHKNEVL